MPEEYKVKTDPLVEKCRDGDSKAQHAVYRNYSKAMYNLAYRMVNSREDAEDILQDAFTQAYRNIGSFRYDSTFGAWLKRIVINHSINFIRNRKQLTFFDDIPEQHEQIYESEEYNDEYNSEKVFKAIEMLPNGYRMVLTLYLLEGYDHEEISEILGITESTSKSQYMRAKAKLRSLLGGK